MRNTENRISPLDRSHARMAFAVILAALVAHALTPRAAEAIFDDPHVGIAELRTQMPVTKKGFCAPAVLGGYQRPCLTDADCGALTPCSANTAYTPPFDDKYPGAAGPIFRPDAEVDISGDIFDPQTLVWQGLRTYDVRLDSTRDANGVGQAKSRFPSAPNNGRRLDCKGDGLVPIVDCTMFNSNPSALVLYPQPDYDYRQPTCSLDPVQIPFFTSSTTFSCLDATCCPAGKLDLDAPGCLATDGDGGSILGDHSVSVIVSDWAMNRCWPIVHRFPFTVAVPKLTVGSRQDERTLVRFKKSCPADAGGSGLCFKRARIKSKLAFEKTVDGLDVGDIDEVRGTPTVPGLIPVHVKLTISRGVSDYTEAPVIAEEDLNLTIKNEGVAGREKWILKKGQSSIVRELRILWKNDGPRIEATFKSDGTEPKVHADAARPDLTLILTFGDLPLAPTGQIAIQVGPDEWDRIYAQGWKRHRKGRRLVKVDAATCSKNGGLLQLDCPVPPNPNAPNEATVPAPAGSQPPPQPAMANMAWNTFIALNWPALDPTTNNDNRGFPDLSKSFKGADPDDLLVWETWKNKREVFFPAPYSDEPRLTAGCTIKTPLGDRIFPNYGSTADPQYRVPPICEWDKEVAYGSPAGETYGPGQDFEFCPGKTADNHNFHSLDATLQVRSQARESQEALCNGGIDGGPLDATPAACTGLPGEPACCEVGFLDDGTYGEPRSGRPVYARVWKGAPNAPTYEQRQMVVYEVKLNYDSFSFLTNGAERYDLDGCAQEAASRALGNLPWRSDQEKPPAFLRGSPSLSSENGGVLQYSAEACLANYEFANEVGGKGNVEPCRVGSIHVQSAWVPLTNGEDQSRYHTANAVHFRKIDPSDPGSDTCVAQEVFGLVGLHITQRTRQRGGATGGTWLFATFEHIDNDHPPGMPAVPSFRYANWWRNENHTPGVNPLAPTDPPLPPELLTIATAGEWFPALSTGGIDAIRLNGPTTATSDANDALHAALGCPTLPTLPGPGDSVWCNYNLTGIQWQPVEAAGTELVEDGNNDPTGIDQQFWLANLLVETNRSSQLWQGQPPQQRVITHYTDEVPDDASTLPPRGDHYPMRLMTGGFDSNRHFLRSNCTVGGATGQGNTPSPDNFHDDYKNLAFTKRAFDMGGCIGCHAGAQTEGFSFSYTFADGQRGVDSVGTDLEIPPDAALAPGVNIDATACDPPAVAACPPMPGL